MISAKEARAKAFNAGNIKELRKMMEDSINRAVEDGSFNVCETVTKYPKAAIDVVFNELVGLGYIVEFSPSKPIPAGCPSDQWYSEDYLKVSWEG